MLEARGLTKRYGALLSVDRISFHVKRGEVLGYLGPNGSGKSTTVNMIVGLLQPGSGTILLDGQNQNDDAAGYKKRIGYVPEEPYLYTHLTALEYLTLVGRLRGIPHAQLQRKATELLRLFQLHDSRYSTMAAFSKGMRQRVLLAASLLHNPDLLVLDEPFSGLDVNASLLFRSLITMLSAEGRMILFSSHRFDMVEMGNSASLKGAADPLPYLSALAADTTLAFGLPMWIAAFITVLISHSLVPDETDFRVLMPLPVTRAFIFGTKLLALAIFCVMF